MALLKDIQRACQQTNVDVNEKQIQQLADYFQLLLQWNEKHNLVAKAEPQVLIVRHLLDCLVVDKFIDDGNCLDVGSGAGLPGMVLGILRPERQVTCLDARQKRIFFLQHVIRSLDLDNVSTAHTRLEQYQVETGFKQIIARGFAPLPSFVAQCKHLCQPDGVLLAMQGQAECQEGDVLEGDMRVDKIYPLTIPNQSAARCLIVVRSIRGE